MDRVKTWMDATLQDLRFAVSSWTKAPTFAIAVIATLALGSAPTPLSLQKRVDEIRNRSLALEEAFLYQRAVDQRSYIEQRDRLREELLLSEMGLSEAQVESFDVEAILTTAEEVISNAGSLWLAALATQRDRLQSLPFPEGG